MKSRSRRLRLDELEDRTVPSSPGDVEWVRQFGSLLQGQAVARAVDAEGAVYVAGQMATTGQTFFDAFVRKYDAAGNELWTRQFGTPNTDQAVGVAVDASGVYVVGTMDEFFIGATQFADAFVGKYDADGNQLWTRRFGAAALDQAWGVAADASGVYVTGVTTAGGGYTLNGETYTETPEYGISSDFGIIKGKAQTFKWKVEGNKWYHNGKLNNGLTIEEVWERDEKK